MIPLSEVLSTEVSVVSRPLVNRPLVFSLWTFSLGTPSVEWILHGGPLEVLIAGDSDHANIQQLLAWLARRLQGDRQANLSLAGSSAPCPLCVASYSNRLAASSEPELGVLSCACLHKLSNPHGRHTPQAKCNAFEANSTHAADAVSHADLVIHSMRAVNRWRSCISPIVRGSATQSCV